MRSIPRRNVLKADEFGDFQTPRTVARQVCRLLSTRGVRPAAIVEPTCGVGNFLLEALDAFPAAAELLGVEINSAYVEQLRAALGASQYREKVEVRSDSFFSIDWPAVFGKLPQPILVLGNPPWVTNAQLGALGSKNLPAKTNFQNHEGLDAITGKSNFDISEWMLIRLVEVLSGHMAIVAMLCKTAVARKVLAHAWKTGISLAAAEIRTIDAGAIFNAAVDACLLVCALTPSASNRNCRLYQDLESNEPAGVIGYREGRMIADIAAYARWKHLQGTSRYEWRSGIKHDCSDVMELRQEGCLYRNGLGELIDLEDTYLYPMLKSSDLARSTLEVPRRWMLVTQREVGDHTQGIELRAPKTWKYLQEHSDSLDQRASTIYRNRPRFSIFGVGEYSFAPWKVAISGFYKRLHFVTVGCFAGKPIVLDDTAYFVACQTEEEASTVEALLNSQPAREFFSAFLFWDAKRPVTADVLRRLDLLTLAREVGTGDVIARLLERQATVGSAGQRDLFGAE